MDATTSLAYIALLEKTNQQLSLWSNPYGVLVGVLSFLVAFLAIAAAVIMYRQSKEYKEIFNKAVQEYQKALQESIKNIGMEAKKDIDLLISEKTKEIDGLTGDTKKQAKKIIADLEKEKTSISSRIQLSSLNDNGPLTIGAYKTLSDTVNSNIFRSSIEDYSKAAQSARDSLLRHSFINTCSKCGAMQYIGSPKFCSNCGNNLSN